MPSPSAIVEETLLIVEGREDERFFKALVRDMSITKIQIEGIGGKNELPRNLKALRGRTGFDNLTTIGLVRDADTHPKRTFQSIGSALKQADFPVPKRPLEIVTGLDFRVAVMILPVGDEATSGMIEDVCLSSVGSEPIIACVDQYFDCLIKQNIDVPKSLSKAKIQVYLAAREPELRLGEAAEKKFWDWNHAAFDPVKHFLNLLLSP